jgi:hypothetical protein
VGVYNAAGEKVRDLFDGRADAWPVGPSLSRSTLVPDDGGVTVDLGVRLNQGPLVWDGANDQGQPVLGGAYSIKVEAKDPFGSATSTILAVQVIPAPDGGAGSLDIYNAAGERVAGLPLTPTAAASDWSLLNNVVVPGETPLSVAVTGLDGVRRNLLWDGRGPGGAPVASGTYSLRGRGRAAGESQQQASFTVLNSAAEAPSAPVLAPNPLPADAAALHILAPGGGGPWHAELYTLGGGLVAQGASAGGNTLALPLAGVSGGVYLAVVHAQDALGRPRQWTLKAAVLR